MYVRFVEVSQIFDREVGTQTRSAICLRRVGPRPRLDAEYVTRAGAHSNK